MESFGKVYNFDPRVDSTLFDIASRVYNGTITDKEVREFGSFLNSHKSDFIRVYHATSVRNDIMGKGLLPTVKSRAKSLQVEYGFVYVSYDPMYALRFAEMAYAGTPGNNVVYALDVCIRRLLPDHDQLFNKRMWANVGDVGTTLAHSLIYGGGARIRGKVDPLQIHIYGVFDKHGNKINE